MAVIFNAKGTTSPYFLLGKGGTTLFQGSADPTGSYTAAAGDVWFDTNTKTLKFRNAGNSDWVQGSIDITGDATISGNLTVNGTTTLVSTTNTTVSDSLIELSTGTTGSPSNDAGIIIERGDSDNAIFAWDESADKFIVGTTTATGASTGDLTITVAPLETGSLGVTGNITVSGYVHSSLGFNYSPTEGGTTLSRYWMLFDQTNNASYPYLTNRTPNGDVVIKSGTTAGGAEIERIRFNGGDGTQDIVISNATLKSDTNVYWHAGNDGAGSGLDADLLDGISSASFLRSDATTTFNANGNDFNFNSDGSRTLINFQHNGTTKWQLLQNNSGNDLNFNYLTGGGQFEVSGNTVWHAGNDGTGSGLDADLLDGNEATAFALLSGATFTGAVSGTSLTDRKSVV